MSTEGAKAEVVNESRNQKPKKTLKNKEGGKRESKSGIGYY